MEGTTVVCAAFANPVCMGTGLNFLQAWNKFQVEVGGHLRHGDPGVRLIEASETGLDFFTTVPAKASRRRKVTGVLHRTTICSVKTKCPSVLRYSSSVCRSRTSSSTPADAAKLGVNAGANIAFSYDGQTISLAAD